MRRVTRINQVALSVRRYEAWHARHDRTWCGEENADCTIIFLLEKSDALGILVHTLCLGMPMNLYDRLNAMFANFMIK